MVNNTEIAIAEKGSHKHRYIFPNFMAKMMSNVDPKTQYESAMLSSFLILLGIGATSIMMIFFMNFSTVYKILIAINCIGGFLYISSSLITVYQQYANYMDIMEIQKTMIMESKGQTSPFNKKIKVKRKYNRWNQFVFGLGVLLFIIGICLFVPSLSSSVVNLIPQLNGYMTYAAIGLIIIGMIFVGLIIRSGRKKMLKLAKIEKLIAEGKITPKPVNNVIRPINQQAKQQVKPVPVVIKSTQLDKKNLGDRLKGLVGSIKNAKQRNQIEEEERIRVKLQEVLKDIKTLKLSERRSNNSVISKGY